MKKKMILKRMMAGFLSVTLVAGIFVGHTINNTLDVQADTRVFSKITENYGASNSDTKHVLKILEISTTPDEYDVKYYYSIGDEKNRNYRINKNSEIGYYLPYNASNPVIAGYDARDTNSAPTYLGFTSRGGKLGDPATGRGVDVTEQWWPEHKFIYGDDHGGEDEYEKLILKFRDYGLVKPFGSDNGWNTYVGEYPLYSVGAIFSSNKNNSATKEIKGSLVPGVYSYAENGDYKLAEGYELNDKAEICTVSMNTISQNGIPVDVPIYTPVDDITNDPDLPKNAAGEYYITKLSEGETGGNLKFTETEAESTLNGKTQYYGYSRNSLWYSPMGETFSMSRNGGWFAEYVLGSYKTYKSVNLTYDVKYASTVSATDIENYDLIYVSGTNAEFSADTKNDIKTEVVKALYESTVNDHKAIIMDYDGYKKNSSTNVSKLAALLWQRSQSDILSDTDKAIVTKDLNTSRLVLNVDKLTDANVSSLKSTMMTEDDTFKTRTNGNFVIGNVYVYNHHMKDFAETKSRVDARDCFANGDFNSAYNSTVVSAGFSGVVSYIQATNKNSLTGNMASDITPAVVVQFILVSDGALPAVTKNSLSVLEIEPAPTYLYNPSQGSYEYGDLDPANAELKIIKENRDKFIEDFLLDRFKSNDLKKRVSFTSMTISEFNGKNDDLVENYDIIYIGSELNRKTGAKKNEPMFNRLTTSSKPWNATKKCYGNNGSPIDAQVPGYHDGNMLGNVYYNIGDYHSSVWGNLSGHVKNDTSKASGAVDLRFPGRDITKDKLGKLKAFLDANALVICGEDIYGYGRINPTAVKNGDSGRVDNSSNMYEFLMYGAGYVWSEADGEYQNTFDGKTVEALPNMVSAADLRTDDATYKKDKADYGIYYKDEKLDLLVTEMPEEYGYTTFADAAKNRVIDPDTVVYLRNKNDAGRRELKFKFSIGQGTTNVDEIDTQRDAQYICRLYIDINNDGKYSKTTEDISDIVVVDPSGNEPIRTQRNGNDHYLLIPGVEYTLTREVSDDYCGILKWKLYVESEDHPTLHASTEGYTMVKNDTGKKKTVKVLQINRNTASTLNLQDSLTAERNAVKNAVAGKPITHNQWGKYLYDLPDYNLEIKTVTVSQFETDFVNKYNSRNPQTLSLKQFAKQYFNEYVLKDVANEEKVVGVNMIVLGFGDNYDNFTKKEAMGAIRSFIEQGNPVLLTHDFIMYGSNYDQVRILRNVVGMDKYGSSQRLVPTNVTGTTTNDTITHTFTNRYTDTGAESTEGLDYLFAGVNYNRTNAADKPKIAAIEGTNREVAYQPGTTRKTLVRDTQGLSFAIMERYTQGGANTYNYTYFNTKGAPGASQQNSNGTADFGEATILKQNDGQITHYPYILPDTFRVNNTHSQYFELDLTSDNDSDGESDVVVWYAFGSGMNGDSKKTGAGANRYDDEYGYSTDPANGYYIYNKGNVTYTGAGHSSLTNAGDFEVQLFVNTLLATFETGNVEPEIQYYDKTDVHATPISSVVVPYDEVVTKPASGSAGVDSSVLKDKNGQYRYKFVDPNTNSAINKTDGTIAYFRIEDKNLVRGTKNIAIRYYLRTDAAVGTTIKTNNNVDKTVQNLEIGENESIHVIDVSDLIETYKVTNNAIQADPMPRNGFMEDADGTKRACVAGIESSKLYGFYLPMDYLNSQASFAIYMEAQTTVTSITTSGDELVNTTKKVYKPLTVVKADLLDLD